MRALVLWDIDLTLLDLRRLGSRWFRRAFVEVTGREVAGLPRFGGRTDRWIARQLLAGVGLEPSDELIARLHDAAVRIAGEGRAEIGELGTVLPGVPDVLGALAALPGVAQTLVTGNLRPIAGYKVDAFGLDRFLDLDIGGYGGTSDRREHLVAEALAGARGKHGAGLAAESVTVVGDTPLDVRAALDNGVRAVGVATGSHSAEELRAAGAHAVLPDLADTPAALAAILPG